MTDELYSHSIFFIDVNKIAPNPYQPRIEFDEARLKELSESIRQYGVLQPLVVTRNEKEGPDGGIQVEYELIAGERRLRASRLAGLSQVPAVIRKEQDPMMKLELAIIENLQREDLNPIDRARAFIRLVNEFGFSHKEVGKKVGRSREYVSNSLRILQLPQDILDALGQKRITEGHTRPLLMLGDRQEEQDVLFKEIMYKKITVREAERLARNIAREKVRKPELLPDPEIEKLEKELQDSLGTRVHINRKKEGGSITIDYFSSEDLQTITGIIEGKKDKAGDPNMMMNRFIESNKKDENSFKHNTLEKNVVDPELKEAIDNIGGSEVQDIAKDFEKEMEEDVALLDDSTIEDEEEDEDLYNVGNFSL
jgi:ParB family chromosome partitioning protein